MNKKGVFFEVSPFKSPIFSIIRSKGFVKE